MCNILHKLCFTGIRSGESVSNYQYHFITASLKLTLKHCLFDTEMHSSQLIKLKHSV